LSGKIVDAKSKEGIAGASVYFPELQRGQATDESGRFQLAGLVKGKLLLQVLHIGYKSFFTRVNLDNDSTIQISLVPSFIQVQEVVIMGAQSQSPQETSFNAVQLSGKQMTQAGSLSISDGMTRLPGVSQLTTGVGISKPVIRGLYGNRIQVNVNGLRFDNQQWQDEHGLGLSEMGVDRVEIIKGPISVLYGSDAMGGVVNVIEEKPAPIDTKSKDLVARVYSNTYGLSLNYGEKKSTQDTWRIIRLGFDNHADYSDGNNDRVLNSRFASYNVKAAWGRKMENKLHTIRVNGSFSEFGFVFDSIARKKEDGRLSRTFDGPHHLVGFAQVTSENTYYKNEKTYKLNGGFISNLRMEDEGGGGISLSMLLNTINALGQVTRPVGRNGEWTYGTSFMFQTNTNFGGRIIVPDAITGEASVFSFYKNRINRFLLETGVRYNLKYIQTFATPPLNNADNTNSPTDEIFPFKNLYNAFNLSAGLGYQFTDKFFFKSNLSTGYRPGNLAELSSNGLHEGTLRWEIGLQQAKIEQNLNVEGSLNFNSSQVHASASVYRNQFLNFFYLAPTGTQYYGFGVYQYLQSDATLQGGELSLDWNPFGSRFNVSSSYSFIQAKKEDGSYLPFIPANKIFGEATLHLSSGGSIANPSLKVGGNYVFDQTKPAEFETATDSYFLLHAGVAGQWKKADLSLVANNLLNLNYFDHLSRFKYYGIANMGLNIVLTINYKF
jgi:iron complex outermembrane receptor protein